MGIFSKGMTEQICRMEWSEASNFSRLRTMATSRYTETAIQIWHLTAFSERP